MLGSSLALLALPPFLEFQRVEIEEMQNMQKKQVHGYILSISFPFEFPVPGKFMVCMGHRLQCKMPNCTNHIFPEYGAEKLERK